MRDRIQAYLRDLAVEEDVTILLAIESGSRAWGFHSPDSDYDVRFIYARPVHWHLSLNKKRDVIERPIDSLLDVGGWELSKALHLALKGNAVVAEWLQSPITYTMVPEARDALTQFATQCLQRRPVSWHYLSLAHNHFERSVAPDGEWRLKRFFYTLRPAMALRWMRINERAMPPMDMGTLMSGCDLPQATEKALKALIAAKAKIAEAGQVDRPDETLIALIGSEIEEARKWLAVNPEEKPGNSLYDAASALHIKWTEAASR
ncbi:UNVERIFIED_CONTAM: hypothetical protein GTU68_018610 [Idotea baltica]|nr:hypothetical protein [Idotea baltica]